MVKSNCFDMYLCMPLYCKINSLPYIYKLVHKSLFIWSIIYHLKTESKEYNLVFSFEQSMAKWLYIEAKLSI